MNQWLLLHRSNSASTWTTIGDYPTLVEARAAGVERAKTQRVGDFAVAQIQAAYTTTVVVTLTQLEL